MAVQQNAAITELTSDELRRSALLLSQQAQYLKHVILAGRAGEFSLQLVFAAFAARVQSTELHRLATNASGHEKGPGD